jgi:tetratricopeptide (TPR) repeat protein
MPSQQQVYLSSSSLSLVLPYEIFIYENRKIYSINHISRSSSNMKKKIALTFLLISLLLSFSLQKPCFPSQETSSPHAEAIKAYESKNFVNLISSWERDWSRVYTDSIRRLFISVDTDFDKLEKRLKQTFARREIYPDLSLSMIRAVRHLLKEDKIDESFHVLNLSAGLYPHSPLSVSGLAEAHLWAGNQEEARRLFKRAHALNPSHSSVSVNAFFNFSRRLEQGKKLDAVFFLMDIATELYPRNSRLYKEIGDMYLRIDKKERAAQYYRKALALNPRYQEARRRLEKLEKEILK